MANQKRLTNGHWTTTICTLSATSTYSYCRERLAFSLQNPFLQKQTEVKGQSTALNAPVMILKRNFTVLVLVSVLLIDISLQFQVSTPINSACFLEKLVHLAVPRWSAPEFIYSLFYTLKYQALIAQR